MKNRTFALSLIFLLCAQTAPVVAAGDDWVDDDQVSGFYKKGIIRTPEDYETMPQDMQPGDMVPSRGATQFRMPQMQSDDFSGMGNSQFSNQMPPQNRQPSSLPLPPQDKSFMGRAKSFGKSIINTPKNILTGTDELLDNPGFWQTAGQAAGMGAGAYMNYKYNRNPYYGGYNPYGYNVPYGSVNPLGGFGYNPYGGIYGNPYGGVIGNPYGGSVVGNPLYGGGMIANPLGGFNNPYGVGGLGAVNPYGMYSPYAGLGGLGGLGGYNGLGGLGLGGYNNGLGGLGGFGGYNNGLGGFSIPGVNYRLPASK
jgi:hypothetical protein